MTRLAGCAGSDAPPIHSPVTLGVSTCMFVIVCLSLCMFCVMRRIYAPSIPLPKTLGESMCVYDVCLYVRVSLSVCVLCDAPDLIPPPFTRQYL